MKDLALTILFTLGFSSLFAQFDSAGVAPSNKRAFLDMVPEFEIAFPVGEFAKDLDRHVLVGKGMGVFYRFANKPVDVGIRFTGLTYDKMHRNFRDSIDDFRAVQKTKNKIWFLQGVVRFEPPVNTSAILYLEGALGWRRFYSKSFSRERVLLLNAMLNDESSAERFNRIKHNSDWGASVGATIGAKFIWDKRNKSALDIQLCYHWGVSGDFMIRNDLDKVREDPSENLVERHSPLTMFSLKIGLSFLGYSEN